MQRRAAAAEAFASSPLPTEKDEVWRYSRIDQLDLDRFRPAGSDQTGGDPGPSASGRIHAMVDGLGTRSGLVVTINGTLATLASSVGDDQLSLGRATDHPEGADLVGTVLADPHEFPLLNDAFAIDPLVIDVQPGAIVVHPVIVVHVVSGAAGGAVFPRTVVRAGAGASVGVIEILVDADTGLLADVPTDLLSSVGSPADRLVVPVTELRVEDGASLAYVSIQSLGGATWQLAHQSSTCLLYTSDAADE